jgi:hypothetical protein
MKERNILKILFPRKYTGDYIRNRKNYDDWLFIGYYASALLMTICCVTGLIFRENRRVNSNDTYKIQPIPLVLNPNNSRVYLPVIMNSPVK